ncbi:MAG: hypothetical protein U0350_11955 [Caldilineaceae bacterium]
MARKSLMQALPWHETPTMMTLAHTFLTLLSGLYIVVRKQQVRTLKAA